MAVFSPGKFHEQRSLVGCSPCTHSRTWLSTHILSLAYAYNKKKVKIPSIFLYELLVKAMTSFPQVNSSRILRNTLKLCIILGVIRKNNKTSDLCSFSLSSVFAPALVWWLHFFLKNMKQIVFHFTWFYLSTTVLALW